MESPEISVAILIATSIALLVIGLGIGTMIGHRSSTGARKYREVERKLDQLLQDKKAYEDEVVAHFTDTAKLLNNLTQSYREVHNHLARGASTLCLGEGPVSLARLEDGKDAAEIPEHLAVVQPPLDYAPKTSPDEKGMLNEEFGLERKKAVARENQQKLEKN